MKVMFLLSFLAIALVVAEGTAKEPYWQGYGYHNPEAQEQADPAEETPHHIGGNLCLPFPLKPDDKRIAAALKGATSLPDIALQPTEEPQPMIRGRFQPMTCEDGPKIIIHSIEDEFHIPHIYKGSCNGLICEDESCRIKRSKLKTKCVLVFRFVGGYWVRVGFRNRYYHDHLECECKQCKHITSRAECVQTTSCPNVNTVHSHCYWRSFFEPSEGVSQNVEELPEEGELMPVSGPGPESIGGLARRPFGHCDCCTPIPCRPPKTFNSQTCSCVCSITYCHPPKYLDHNTCRCLCPPAGCMPPLVQNPTTCRCECPLGTKMSSGGKCLGDCRDVSPNICSRVYCEDNPSLTCKQITAHDCHCPSCADASTATCTNTRCLGQPSKPKCVINEETRRCDCPTCHHHNNPLSCTATRCGKSPSLNCKFSLANKHCYCPYQGCPPLIGK